MTDISVEKRKEPAFGMSSDGRDLGVSFRSLIDARNDARLLADHGYKNILIFDRSSCEIVDPSNVRRLRA